MDLSDKPIFGAALMSTGGAAVAFALGQPVEGTVLSAVAGMGLMAAVRFVPERLQFSSENIPQIRAIGWRPAIVSPDHSRMLSKLHVDFTSSPLPGRESILSEISDVRSKAQRFGGDRAERLTAGIEYLQSAYHPPLDVFWDGDPKRANLEPLLAMEKPLSVSCSVIEPAVLAALLDMKLRLGIGLDIHYADVNGVAQVDTAHERLTAGSAFDVMIIANAPLLCSGNPLSGTAIRDLYEFALPIHREHQHVLRAKLKDLGKFRGVEGIEKVKYLGESSCEEQYRGTAEFAGKGKPWGISDLPGLLDGLEGNEAAILYDPAASRLVGSGAFVSVPGRDYSLWISMFLLTETLQRLAIRTALLNAFVASWVFCKAHRNHAWKLLTSDPHIVPAFQRALFRRA